MILNASWSEMEAAIGQLSRDDFSVWALKHAWEVSRLTRPPSLPEDDRLLHADFLRMYLAHETNEPALAAVGRLIAASSDYEHLRLGVEQELQLKANRRGRRPSTKEIAADAREYLQLVRATVGIHFQGRLQSILGSVGAVDVPEPATILNVDTSLFHDAIDFEIRIVLKDTYGFADPSCGDDAEFCKRLLTLLADRRYFDFRYEYLWETIPHTNRLAGSTVFAAFMHALEKYGFTRGLFAWQVAVPLRGRLVAPSDAICRFGS